MDKKMKRTNNIKKNINNKKKKINKPSITPKHTLTVFRSLVVNWKSWVCIFLAVYILSYPNHWLGIATFIALTFMAYGVHAGSHYYRNVFTILHHYHHENSNWVSHFSQMLMELSFPVIFYPFYFLYSDIFVEPWIVLFFTLVYTTVHNINYGFFRVNDVHRLHHENIRTNIGPDICDILFGTKHPENTTVENTDHQIPNLCIMALVVLLVKYIYSWNNIIQWGMRGIMHGFLVCAFFSVVLMSIYLMVYYENREKREKIERK
jgi:hypothetical protein